MVTKIQQWGNSLGVRIPKAFAEEAQVSAGSAVEISVEGGSLIVRPISARKYKLNELLAGVKPRNLHREVSTGRRVGREVW
jgi:antitoxin MazE